MMANARETFMVAATTLALGGCYSCSAQCESIGYGPQGSSQNARCVYTLSQSAQLMGLALMQQSTPTLNGY